MWSSVVDTTPFIVTWLHCWRRCLVALYFVGADKAQMQAALAAAGVVAPVVRLCRSSQPELQAEAVDVVKVLSRHPRASRVIVDLGELPPNGGSQGQWEFPASSSAACDGCM